MANYAGVRPARMKEFSHTSDKRSTLSRLPLQLKSHVKLQVLPVSHHSYFQNQPTTGNKTEPRQMGRGQQS